MKFRPLVRISKISIAALSIAVLFAMTTLFMNCSRINATSASSSAPLPSQAMGEIALPGAANSDSGGAGIDGKVFVVVNPTGACADQSAFSARIVFSSFSTAILTRLNCSDVTQKTLVNHVDFQYDPAVPNVLTYSSMIFSPETPDPYFLDVKLLLHMGGPNFVDVLGNQFTANGMAGISNKEKGKFGLLSGFLGDGSANYALKSNVICSGCVEMRGSNFIHAQSASIEASTFTIETWVYLTSPPVLLCMDGPGICPIISEFDTYGANTVWSFGIDASGDLRFYWTDGPSINYVSSNGPSISTGVWHHVAITAASGRLRIWIDGQRRGSAAQIGVDAQNMLSAAVHLGSGGQSSFPGYIDELRVTVGVARYNDSATSFFLPSAPYPSN